MLWLFVFLGGVLSIVLLWAECFVTYFPLYQWMTILLFSLTCPRQSPRSVSFFRIPTSRRCDDASSYTRACNVAKHTALASSTVDRSPPLPPPENVLPDGGGTGVQGRT